MDNIFHIAFIAIYSVSVFIGILFALFMLAHVMVDILEKLNLL